MGNDKDRLFINRFENFIFTVRKILYFGDTSKYTQFTDPKHDRSRFIKYFGTDCEYYDTENNEFAFNNNNKLKNEFSLLFSYKSINKIESGDFFDIFAALTSKKAVSASSISAEGGRSEKNINRRLHKSAELFNSGVIYCDNSKPAKYSMNNDLIDGFTKSQKLNFLKALDFAIKKNNFISHASSYKRLVECRDDIDEINLDIDVEHQLFHPILDEFNVWTALSAIDSRCYIDIEYLYETYNQTTTIFHKGFIPIKIVFDNVYGRSYLIGGNESNGEIVVFRFDRIYDLEIGKKIENTELFRNMTENVDNALETAWSICIDNSNIQRVVAEFKNIPSVEYRLKNEMRHGKITNATDDILTFQIDVNDPLEMTYWFLSYGPNCVVKQPKCLVDKIINTLEEVSK